MRSALEKLLLASRARARVLSRRCAWCSAPNDVRTDTVRERMLRVAGRFDAKMIRASGARDGEESDFAPAPEDECVRWPRARASQ